jgi:hypothetical protein
LVVQVDVLFVDSIIDGIIEYHRLMWSHV